MPYNKDEFIDDDMTYMDRYRLIYTMLLTALLAGGSMKTMAQDSGSSTGVVVHGNVYGGGNLADVKTNTEVNICAKKQTSGETVTYVAVAGEVTIEGNVYGGGKGQADEFTCSKAMVGVEGAGLSDPNGGTTVRIGNGTIGTMVETTNEENQAVSTLSGGNVYGGGEIGRVEKNTKVIIGIGNADSSNPKILGNVFGAGAGAATHGYSALVRGNSEVTVQAKAEVSGSVYGGGEIATVGRYIVINGYPTEPNGGGKCTVEVKDNAAISGNVVGAGKGVEPTYSSTESKHAIPGTALVTFADEAAYLVFLETLALASETQVTIGGTTDSKTATVNGNVYGGSESGFLQRHTQVTILDHSTVGTSSANGNVYGGGKGLPNFADAGRVSGYTSVTISGGTTHGSVYGGGELGYTKGGATVNMAGGNVNHDVYGGGALADTNIGNGTEYVAVPGLTTSSSVVGLYEKDYTQASGTALDGKTYYELKNDLYVVKTGLIVGESSVDGLYVINYQQTEDTKAALGKTYYEEDPEHQGVYLVKTRLTAGESISGLYEIHYNKITTAGTTAVDGKSYYSLTHPTTVNLLGGIIGGNAYGGGLGRFASSTESLVEAKVYGDTKVNLNGMTVGEKIAAPASIQALLATQAIDGNGDKDLTDADDDYYTVSSKGCIVNQVFGCNNQKGSPQGNVTVHVFATQNASKTRVGDKFINDNIDLTKGTDETDDAYLVRLKDIHAKEILLATALNINTDSYQIEESSTETQVKTAINNVIGAINAKTSAEINAVKYDLKAVYGGGNEAAYVPATPYHPTSAATGSKTQVIIEGCEYTTIETVYGGGNAASVPEANVAIKAAYEIGTVFGGGNGNEPTPHFNPNPGADIGTYKNTSNADVPYGTGNANTLITGGYIHEAYGGSNERGTIIGSVNLTSNAGAACPMLVKKMVTAGKNADIMGDAITILGCMPDSWVEEYYGGADNANVHGKVELTITSGNFRKVFGGNNKSGIIMGHIKVNIEETGCIPININELYLGGNDAAYSTYGYYVVPETDEDGNIVMEGGKPKPLLTDNGKLTFAPRESATDTHLAVTSFNGTTYTEQAKVEGETYSFEYDAHPELNIISCTHIGQVFGGGYGTGAIMYGDPTVNINMIKGSHYNNISRTADNPNQLGEIGTVYGGGNAADVIGNPTVNIGTESTVGLVSTEETGKPVLGAYITGNVYGGGMGEADNFLCDKAMIGKENDGIANPTGGTTVNIYNGFVRGNVYGGGQIGRVEKNTAVTIGTGGGVAPGGTVTSAPIIMGSVYGGGAGEEKHGYAALVRGNPTVTIQGNAKVRHSVYGGGEIASVARYKVPRTEKDVKDAIAEGYTEAVLGMPYALKDESSGTCTVIVRGYAEIGPETAMQMTKAVGPDDTGYVFGAGKGILPGGKYEFEQGTTKRMVLYDAAVHTTVGQQGSKWQWADPDHENVWEYFENLDEYIKFIQTLALSSRTYVTITDDAFVKGSVYGGSENGIVQFNTDVKIQGGQIGAGDGMTEPYKETDWAGTTTPTNGWKECASWTFVEPYAPYDPYATNLYNGQYYYDSNHTQEAAGGASVATDGHTYYGNVFGGGSGSVPYFDHTLGRSVYLHSAGQVKGNTNVTISGGHILTNVYGGNEATNVDGTANVTMTDGTVGVPRTDVQIIAHPLTGYIFGGGKGDQRVFFNKDTNVKDAVVTIEGGRVYGSVYGGGEDGHVMRNVTLTIGKQTTTGEGENAVTTTSGPKIGTKGTSYYDGHVFGGGRGFGGDALTAGNVGGSVDVNILDGEILGSVYGGGRLASVGYGLYLVDEEVTIGGETMKPYGTMRPDDVYDDPSKPTSTEDAEDFFTKGRGHINITISGGTIGNGDEYAYDANNQLSHTKGGNVFAGGMGRMYKLDGTTPISSLDWWKLGCVKSTKLTITGGTIKGNVYGGGELGMVQGGNHTSADSKTVSTEIIINGGTIGTEIKSGNVTQYTFGSVFGGGYGSLTEKLDHTGSTNPTYSTYKYTYPKYIAGRVKGSTEVTMTGGEVKASVYGGGEMAAVGESKVLYDSTDPKILGETLTGNNGAPIEANTYVTISDGIIGKEKVGTTYFGGSKMGNVYGGGSGDNNTVRSGHVYGNTNVNVSNGTIYHNVYGGGAYGSVGDFDYDTKDEEVTVNNQTVTVKKVSGISGLNTNHTNSGVATVNITGGTIGIDGKDNGMVFGSSRGDINQPEERDDYTAWVYNANVTIGTAGTPASGTEGQEGYVPATNATGPKIKGSVYGGGENGHTFNNTVVTVNGGTIGIAEGSPVTSKDKEYTGAAYPYRGNVYGGGCGTDKYYSKHSLENHSGEGDYYNPLAGIVYGTSTVNINDGTVVRNVYGAGAMGSVGKTTWTTTTTGEGEEATTVTTATTAGGSTMVNINGGIIGTTGTVGDGNVFGAARGSKDIVQADYINDLSSVSVTNVTVSGGTVKGNVYGGGELGDVGTIIKNTSDYNYTWQKTGGGANTALNNGITENNTNTGICNVTITGGTIGSSTAGTGNVFGGGKGDANTWWCEKAMAFATNVKVSEASGSTTKVYGTVYGGGEIGRVEDDSKVIIGTADGSDTPEIVGSVFGAGKGLATRGYSALVRGNSIVTIQGNAQVGGNVFGGGEEASLGRFELVKGLPKSPLTGGSAAVTIQDNAHIGSSGTDNDVYGAGKGVEPNYVTDPNNPNKYKDYKSMQLIGNVPSGDEGDTWDYYVDDDGKIDRNFIWVYYKTEAAYQSFLNTLAIASNPTVTIAEDAIVYGDVYGGGQRGITLGRVNVNITGGTVKQDVYGGGSLADTNKGNWDADRYVEATVTAGASVAGLYTITSGSGTAESPYVYTPTAANAMAVDGKTYYRKGTWAEDRSAATYTTNVTLTGGEIDGNVYGGGLGQLGKAAVAAEDAVGTEGEEGYVPAVAAQSAVSPVEAKVYGNVLVKLNEDTENNDCYVKGTIFGCNNLNGSPQNNVTVYVYKTVKKSGNTVQAKPAKNTKTYELTAVYGGGNLAAYYPDDETSRGTAIAKVIIDGCSETSICSVYGGGNAASVPATDVVVNATYEIEEVFGGGNGKDPVSYDGGTTNVANPGANVGYSQYPTSLDPPVGSIEARNEYAYGLGKAHATIYGGTVHTVYGGSNTKGNVREESRTTLVESGSCLYNVGNAYGGGNNADQDGNSILEVGCMSGLDIAYGGASDADVNGDVILNITNGTYGRVFGGNNLGGAIRGSITVNIEETGCNPIVIGELYGGGNLAAYSVYGYDAEGEVLTSGSNPVLDPVVNVKSFTSIGNVYGGGFGASATMVGNPVVNINVVKGRYSDEYAINDNAKVVGTTVKYDSNTGYPIPSHALDAIGAINNVFGGGNEARVIGDTYVNIGTMTYEYTLVNEGIEVGVTDVSYYYTRTGKGTTANPYVYTKCAEESKAAANTSYYERHDVIGADIRGNVYGGGNQADVSGNTNVTIGKGPSASSGSGSEGSGEGGEGGSGGGEGSGEGSGGSEGSGEGGGGTTP